MKNIIAGADIHAGDGGYQIGTQEKYDAFVKARNQALEPAMSPQMQKLLGEAFDKAVPYTWDSLDYYEVMKVMQVFGELLVKECADISDASFHQGSAGFSAIKKEFGVDK